MTEISLCDVFSRQDFLAEVHHHLWIKPFVNRGQMELGWCCRDHALTLGLVAALLGHKAVLVSGRAQFVQGPSLGRNPFGIEQGIHSWLRTSEGAFDLSWRLDKVRNAPQWKPWGAAGIVGGKAHPAGAATFFSTADRVTHENRCNAATHVPDAKLAGYLMEKVDELDAALVDRQYAWVNSPLTDRLRRIAPGLYAAAAMHLIDFLGGREALRDVDQDSAWVTLARRYPNALNHVVQVAADVTLAKDGVHG